MPLCRGKSGKEALCCLRPHDDPYPADYPAAREVAFHTMPPLPACRACIRTLQGGKPGSLPADTGSPFAVSDPVSTPPAPPHGKHRFAPCPRTRPAGHVYTRSKGNPGSLPTDTGLPFAVGDPANTPPVTPHGGAFLACACPHPPTHQAEPPRTAAPAAQSSAQQKTGHT